MRVLINKGLDVNDANLSWLIGDKNRLEYFDIKDRGKTHFANVPAYILSDIIRKLPKRIGDWRIRMNKTGQKWCVCYINSKFSILYSVYNADLLNAAYEMLLWGIDKGYVKTKKR